MDIQIQCFFASWHLALIHFCNPALSLLTSPIDVDRMQAWQRDMPPEVQLLELTVDVLVRLA